MSGAGTDGRDNELVNQAWIANIAKVRKSAVSNWRSRYADFPSPAERSARGDLFARDEVLEWLKNRSKIDPTDSDLIPAPPSPGASAFEEALSEWLSTVAKTIQPAHTVTGLDLAWPVGAIQVKSGGVQGHRFDAALDQWLGRERSLSQYRTGDVLRHLMVDLASRPNVRSILDPASGAGALLAEAGTRAVRGGSLPDIYGLDINPAFARLASLRLDAHGLKADLRTGDALSDDPFAAIKADVVLLDAPYGSRVAKDAHWSPNLAQFLTGTGVSSADLPWLFYAATHLTPEGTAVVALPMGSLSRMGADDRLRRELLRLGCVEAVISLPPGLASGTSIPLALWLLRSMEARTPAQDVTLIDASARGEGWTDPAEAVEDVRRLREAALGASSTATRAGSNWRRVRLLDLLVPNLPLIPAYWLHAPGEVAAPEISAQVESELSHLATSHTSAKAILEAPRLRMTSAQNGSGEVTTLGALDDAGHISIHRGLRLPLTELAPEGPIPVITAGSLSGEKLTVSGFHAGGLAAVDAYVTKPGDVLFRPEGQPTATVDHQGGHLLAHPLVAITVERPEAAPQPRVLAAMLGSEHVSSTAAGTTIKRIAVRQVRVPLLTEEANRLLTDAFQRLDQHRSLAAAWTNAAQAADRALASAAALGLQPEPERP